VEQILVNDIEHWVYRTVPNKNNKLQNRRKRRTVLKNDQYGFRRQKGTREVILGLRVLIEKQIDRNNVIYLTFVDLEKDFNKINWNKMLLTLREICVEQRDLRIIHSPYKNQTGKITSNTQIKNGVRKWFTLSSPIILDIDIAKKYVLWQI